MRSVVVTAIMGAGGGGRRAQEQGTQDETLPRKAIRWGHIHSEGRSCPQTDAQKKGDQDINNPQKGRK
jgi:hypothetical protein